MLFNYVSDNNNNTFIVHVYYHDYGYDELEMYKLTWLVLLLFSYPCNLSVSFHPHYSAHFSF